MLKNTLIDGIIREPLGGAHTDPDWMIRQMRKHVLKEVKELLEVSVEDRISKRIDKFSQMGVVNE